MRTAVQHCIMIFQFLKDSVVFLSFVFQFGNKPRMQYTFLVADYCQSVPGEASRGFLLERQSLLIAQSDSHQPRQTHFQKIRHLALYLGTSKKNSICAEKKCEKCETLH